MAQSDLRQGIENANLASTIEEQEESSFDTFIANLTDKENATIAAEERIARAKTLIDKGFWDEQQKQLNALNKNDADYAQKVAEIKRKENAKVLELAKKMEENLYKYSSNSHKQQMKQEQKDTITSNIERMKAANREAQLKDNHWKENFSKQQKYDDLLIKSGQKAIELEQDKRRLIEGSIPKDRKSLEEKYKMMTDSAKEEVAQREKNLEGLQEELKILEEKAAAGDIEDEDAYNEEKNKLENAIASEESGLKDSKKEAATAELIENSMKGMTNALNQGLANLGKQLDKAVDSAMDTLAKYRSGIEARLQGSQSSYDKMQETMQNALALSPAVKQTEVLAKFDEAVKKGIAYNVEQRAFLGTIADKIATTFDAFDSNLMRLIRLQQADSTAARMGLEANLTQFLNSTFSDTSYLSDGFDDVSSALIDASANMSRDMSLAFEYNVQKWMGSLASLGFGTNTLKTIAEGVGYLGSGNVQALSGNTQLQNLLAMSASRAGLSYSDMLVEGIDDSEVNKLLKSMIEYLKEIASNDNNKVVKAAYGDIFNFSQSDLRAISSIGPGDISNIFNQTLSYSEAVAETSSQLTKVYSRLSTAEMIDNIFDNFTYTAASDIANSFVGALTYKTLSMIEEFTGGIHLPAISVMGNMVDLSTFTIEGMAKTAIFGLSALGNLGKMISSIANKGGMELGIWGGTEYNSRGGGFTPSTKGVQSSTSMSQSITSASSSDTKKESLSSTEEDQEMMKKSSEESSNDKYTIDDFYRATLIDNKKVYVYDPLVERVEKDIYKKLSIVIPVADSGSREKLQNIHNVLSNTPTVSISGLDTALAAIAPKDTQSVKLTNWDGISKYMNNLQMAFQTALSGGDVSTFVNDNEGKSLADLITYLMAGDLEVKDKNSDIIVSKLTKIEEDIN